MPLFDLHSHFSFKPANSYSSADALPDVDHWNERLKRKKDWLGFSGALANEVIKSTRLPRICDPWSLSNATAPFVPADPAGAGQVL